MDCGRCRFNWDNFVPLIGGYEKQRGYCFFYSEKQDSCYMPEAQSIDGKLHKKALEKNRPKNVLKIAG